ncbi:glycine cleavage system protein GcvH [Salisaeta longa]|uniref:glycine cleavage system protein GcvH n=1 Tax=Salisaeta longa TaxID=503170 RepID=UPI0003B390CE|nr:glycine cleavage system protein GcvH [Salisaeta longa]
MSYPEDLYYTDDHEWLRTEDDGTATIGVTNFAQQELGDIVFVELDPEGTSLQKGDVFGTIEAVKTVSELFMPASGTIVDVNTALEDAPETVNDDPYGDGWMVRIELENMDDLDDLMNAEAYEQIA